jgi:hypothetical protein
MHQVFQPDTSQYGNRSSEARLPLPASASTSSPIQESLQISLTLKIAGSAVPVLKEVVLGRNGDLALEAFRGVREVSRRHCQLTPDAGRWWLKQLSENSPTTLNGIGLAFEQECQLRVDLNEVVLGEILAFTLKVGSASDIEMIEEEGYPDPFVGSQRRQWQG